MLGNRDFLMASEFERKSGCQIIKEPFELKHNNKIYLLVHGDSLCTDDVDYQKLKKVLRNPIIQFIFLHSPKNLRLKLTGQLRKKSVEALKYKVVEIMDVNQSTVDNLMANHPCTDLIHGHTHRQNTHMMEGYTRYVLGDWSNKQGNAIKLEETLDWLEIN
jgi:UDP-2,3-diacylglucosamine hydrolase